MSVFYWVLFILVYCKKPHENARNIRGLSIKMPFFFWTFHLNSSLWHHLCQVRLISILRICSSSYSFDYQRGTLGVLHLTPRKCSPSKEKQKSLKFPFPAFYLFTACNFQVEVVIETHGKIEWWSVTLKKMRMCPKQILVFPPELAI